MASGGKRHFTGTFTGTGALVSVKIIGFRPTKVELYNRAGDSAMWTDQNADATMHKRTAAGAGSFAATNGVTPLGDGFSLGTDGDLNVNGEIVDYVAHD